MSSQVEHSLVIRDGHDEVIASVNVVPAYGVRFVTALYVHPEHRRQGHASSLLQEIVRVFGREPLYIHALPYADRPRDGFDLMALYEKFGFRDSADERFPGGMWRPADT